MTRRSGRRRRRGEEQQEEEEEEEEEQEEEEQEDRETDDENLRKPRMRMLKQLQVLQHFVAMKQDKSSYDDWLYGGANYDYGEEELSHEDFVPGGGVTPSGPGCV